MENKTEITVLANEVVIEIIKKMIEELDNSATFYEESFYENKIVCYIPNTNNVLQIEGYLDVLRSTNPKLRYNIMVYTRDKKHPSSIRINKHGKKILTSQQTKYLAL